MKRFIRALCGMLSIGLGTGAIWLATACYQGLIHLAPLTGGFRALDYVALLALGSAAAAFFVYGYILLFKSRA